MAPGMSLGERRSIVESILVSGSPSSGGAGLAAGGSIHVPADPVTALPLSAFW